MGTSSSTSITSQGSRPGGAVLMVVVRAPPAWAGTTEGGWKGGWAARLAVQAVAASQSGVQVHTITALGGRLLLAAVPFHSPSSTSCRVSPSACSRSLSNSSSTPSPSSSPSSPVSGIALRQQQQQQGAASGARSSSQARPRSRRQRRQELPRRRQPPLVVSTKLATRTQPLQWVAALAGSGGLLQWPREHQHQQQQQQSRRSNTRAGRRHALARLGGTHWK